jgi:hypothetical protein
VCTCSCLRFIFVFVVSLPPCRATPVPSSEHSRHTSALSPPQSSAISALLLFTLLCYQRHSTLFFCAMMSLLCEKKISIACRRVRTRVAYALHPLLASEREVGGPMRPHPHDVAIDYPLAAGYISSTAAPTALGRVFRPAHLSRHNRACCQSPAAHPSHSCADSRQPAC